MNIRNFSIIAHIDHGKSTLADRILEKTKTISKREMKDRFLDTLELEQEKGITIKLQTARMKWQYSGKDEKYKDKLYTLNLIDTPGHVDFSFEVSRSIAASEGVILLVDATQGVQAQTISNFYKALEQDLEIIPAISKIDLENAEVEKTKDALVDIFGFKKEEIILTSGKTGEGVEELLDAIVEKIPAPSDDDKNAKLLVFDSFFHLHKGVVTLVKVASGEIESKDKLYALQSKAEIDPVEIGYLRPMLQKQKSLKHGDVGYIATGLKNIRRIHVGDTITKKNLADQKKVSPLAGYKPPKPMIFASLYPTDNQDFDHFTQSLEKLALNDAALTYTKETSPVLGSGYCIGFLGLLHLEIVQERLSREFETEVFTTSPSVQYKVDVLTDDESKYETKSQVQFNKKGKLLARRANEFPRQELISQVYEPWVKLEIVSPTRYMGPIIELAKDNRGMYQSTEYLSSQAKSVLSDYVILKFEIPTAEIISQFFDKLKSISQGYASMDYEHYEYRKSNIVKVTILINHEEIDALSFLTHKSNAERKGRRLVEKLAETIPRQQFEIPVQAAIGGKIIARANIKAYRKDVTAKLYGGDVTRKKKLLEKQKKGKKKMKQMGSVQIPKEAFLEVLKTD